MTGVVFGCGLPLSTPTDPRRGTVFEFVFIGLVLFVTIPVLLLTRSGAPPTPRYWSHHVPPPPANGSTTDVWFAVTEADVPVSFWHDIGVWSGLQTVCNMVVEVQSATLSVCY